MLEHRLITPTEGREKIYNLLEEISSSSSSSNVKLLELIVGLEGRFSKANSSNKAILNKMRELQSERDEWIRAFYSIVDHLSEFSATKDNSSAEISERMTSLSILLKESSDIEDELNKFLEETSDNERYIAQISEQYSQLAEQDENIVPIHNVTSASDEKHSSPDAEVKEEVDHSEETLNPSESVSSNGETEAEDGGEDDFDEGFSLKK